MDMKPTVMRKRSQLTIGNKKEIINYYEDNRDKKQQHIADHFNVLWGISINRRTISDIIREKSRWMNISVEKRVRMKAGKQQSLEKALLIWIDQSDYSDTIITDDIIKRRAKEFGSALGIEKFAYSNGWVQRFKERHGVKCGGVEICAESIENEIEKLKETMGKFDTKDIFNMNEIGLFYNLLPSRSSTIKVKDTRKDYVSVVLTYNADGTEKLPPLVISEEKKVVNFNPALYKVEYEYVRKTKWPTSPLAEYLRRLNRRMASQDRNILLIHDVTNSKSFTSASFSNVVIVHIPSANQRPSIDDGVERSFKTNVRRLQLEAVAAGCANRRIEDVGETVKVISKAWNSISESEIRNCWRRSRLEDDTDVVEPKEEAVSIPDEVYDLCGIEEGDRIEMKEFVDVEATLRKPRFKTDREIIAMVLAKGDEETEDEGAEGEMEFEMDDASIQTVRESLRNLYRFLEWTSNEPAHILRLDELSSSIEKLIHENECK